MAEFEERDYVKVTMKGIVTENFGDWIEIRSDSGVYVSFPGTPDVKIEKIEEPVPTKPGIYTIDKPPEAPIAYTLSAAGEWWYGSRTIDANTLPQGLRKIA